MKQVYRTVQVDRQAGDIDGDFVFSCADDAMYVQCLAALLPHTSWQDVPTVPFPAKAMVDLDGDGLWTLDDYDIFSQANQTDRRHEYNNDFYQSSYERLRRP